MSKTRILRKKGLQKEMGASAVSVRQVSLWYDGVR